MNYFGEGFARFKHIVINTFVIPVNLNSFLVLFDILK